VADRVHDEQRVDRWCDDLRLDINDRFDDEGDQLVDLDPATWALRLDVDEPRIDSQWDDDR